MRPSGSLVTRLIRSRPLMQAARDSPAVQELAQQWFAGELITDAVFLAAKLRRQGLSLSFHHLPASDELNTAAQLSHLLEALGPDAKGVELSVKPSTIGLRESAVLADVDGIVAPDRAPEDFHRPDGRQETLASVALRMWDLADMRSTNGIRESELRRISKRPKDPTLAAEWAKVSGDAFDLAVQSGLLVRGGDSGPWHSGAQDARDRFALLHHLD